MVSNHPLHSKITGSKKNRLKFSLQKELLRNFWAGALDSFSAPWCWVDLCLYFHLFRHFYSTSLGRKPLISSFLSYVNKSIDFFFRALKLGSHMVTIITLEICELKYFSYCTTIWNHLPSRYLKVLNISVL